MSAKKEKEKAKVAGEGEEGEDKSGPGSRGRYLMVSIGLLAIAVAASGFGFYYYNQYSDLRTNPQRAAQEETRTLVERVGRLIVLPDEQPTVATVADPERLRNQPFFANAQTGYKVLIYTNALKAILYDPVNSKIVEVAPLNIGQTAGVTAESETESADDEEE